VGAIILLAIYHFINVAQQQVDAIECGRLHVAQAVAKKSPSYGENYSHTPVL